MILLNKKEELFFNCTKHGYFKTLELNQEETLNSECLKVNLLFFVIDGELTVTYNEFIGKTLTSNQVIHFTKSGNFISKANSTAKIVIFAYSVPRTICDRSAIEDLRPFIKDKEHTLPSITLERLIPLYLLDIVRYAEKDGFKLYPQLHEIKENELFILFRTQVEKQQLADLFCEIISESFHFKNKVLQHYAQAKTVLELSQLCGYSPKTFSRIFCEYFNTTPYKWLQEQKSKLIPAYITHNPEQQLIIISEKFGFSSLSHFNIFCRKHYGLSAKLFKDSIIQRKK